MQSNKNYQILETLPFQIKLVSLISNILSEGTFFRVVVHMIYGFSGELF